MATNSPNITQKRPSRVVCNHGRIDTDRNIKTLPRRTRTTGWRRPFLAPPRVRWIDWFGVGPSSLETRDAAGDGASVGRAVRSSIADDEGVTGRPSARRPV